MRWKNPPHVEALKPGQPEYRLRKAVESSGMTQVQLAKKAGVSVVTVNRVLRGGKCRHATKGKILKALDITFSGHRWYFSK